jgi:predicted enzyme related to lactoylglutathione lyase
MATVTGVGGVFFRARDPDALKHWYQTHLGIPRTDVLHAQEGASLVFGVFREDTDHFPAAQQWMVNLRVDDLVALLEQLRAAGVEIVRTEEEESLGRFAWITDPEGNRVELWEPAEGK